MFSTILSFSLIIISVSCQSRGIPSICRGGSDRGLCDANINRFFYDEPSNTCQPFYWSGCGGNNNNFVLQGDCERQCVQKPKLRPRDHPKLKRCYLKPDEGPGRANFKRYYYDPATRRCQEFYYGGRNGNDNRFDTFEECHEKCTIAINRYRKLVPTVKN
ncbi:kunitz-type serine protease inhibitor A-like [Culicoides brevitarsis]|uniref:kunitz-type serine protease inhibitor A-like n=1 Tax=Culicoides brevitarsis TaxID=469753 RepID=UPI00307B5F12